MIGIVYALLVLIAAATGGLITFALKNSTARDQREAARVLASSNAGEIKILKERNDRLTKDLDAEQARSNSLDDELAKTYDHPDPVGARDRVLQAWKLEHDVSRGRAVSLPAPPATGQPGPNDLLDPNAE